MVDFSFSAVTLAFYVFTFTATLDWVRLIGEFFTLDTELYAYDRH